MASFSEIWLYPYWNSVSILRSLMHISPVASRHSFWYSCRTHGLTKFKCPVTMFWWTISGSSHLSILKWPFFNTPILQVLPSGHQQHPNPAIDHCPDRHGPVTMVSAHRRNIKLSTRLPFRECHAVSCCAWSCDWRILVDQPVRRRWKVQASSIINPLGVSCLLNKDFGSAGWSTQQHGLGSIAAICG